MGIAISNNTAAGPAHDCQAISSPRDMSAADMAPILAGAQARGMADMLEMLGHGAILLDRSANVLFCSDRAREMIAGAVFISGGQLLGRGAAARELLDRVLGAAMSGSRGDEVPFAAQVNESQGFTIQSLAAPAGPGGCIQLLQAVLVVRST